MQFEGKFVFGEKKEGRITFHKNVFYKGEFRNNIFHGKGTLTTENRTIGGIWNGG